MMAASNPVEAPPTPSGLWLDVSLCGDNPSGIPRMTRNLALALRRREAEGAPRLTWMIWDGSGRYREVTRLPSPEDAAIPAKGWRRMAMPPARRLIAAIAGLPLPPWIRTRLRAAYRAGRRLLAGPPVDAPPQHPPRLLLLPHIGAGGMPVADIARLRNQGARTAAICCDILPLDRPELFLPHHGVEFREAVLGILPHLDHILCISEHTRDALSAWSRRHAIPIPETDILPCIIDLPEPDPRLWRRVNLDPSTVPIIAMVASFVPRKGHRLALEVMERLWRAGQDATLLMIGMPHPAGAAILSELRAHPRHGEALRLVHDATDAEVAEVYRVARASLMPSEAEGFGMPIGEAALAGCPVLCSDIPVFREVGGTFATYAPSDPEAWADALRKILTQAPDTAQRARTRLAARQRFTEDAILRASRVLARISRTAPPSTPALASGSAT